MLPGAAGESAASLTTAGEWQREGLACSSRIMFDSQQDWLNPDPETEV